MQTFQAMVVFVQTFFNGFVFLCAHLRWLSCLWTTCTMADFFVRTVQVIVVFVRTFYDDLYFCAHISNYDCFVHLFLDGFCFCFHI